MAMATLQRTEATVEAQVLALAWVTQHSLSEGCVDVDIDEG
jgi:hypothetical protein